MYRMKPATVCNIVCVARSLSSTGPVQTDERILSTDLGPIPPSLSLSLRHSLFSFTVTALPCALFLAPYVAFFLHRPAICALAELEIE